MNESAVNLIWIWTSHFFVSQPALRQGSTRWKFTLISNSALFSIPLKHVWHN